MKKINFLQSHITIATASIFLTLGMLAFASTSAAPTVAPPDGNPTFPAGPQGLQGPQGSRGNTGSQGNQGPKGPQGPAGAQGIAWCAWYNGTRYVSHGWDGGCAWEVGAFIYCQAGRLTSVSRDNDGFYNSTNCNATPHSNHYGRGHP